MPRSKAFDENKALSAAMQCFWHKGYSATSMKDLERATGLTPSSLYNSFESKDGLFLRTVDFYIEHVVRRRIHAFLENEEPLAGIEQFIRECFENKAAMGMGCLLVNTSTELGPHDEIVRKKVAKGMSLVEKALEEAIERAIDQGLLSKGINPKKRAKHIGLLLNGMLVNSKIAGNKHWLETALDSVKDLLH